MGEWRYIRYQRLVQNDIVLIDLSALINLLCMFAYRHADSGCLCE